MELPPALRHAVDLALDGSSMAAIAASAATLSRRYRGEVRDGSFHVGEDAAALAYLATRLPATFAAMRSAIAACAERRTDFAPASLLDLGAGPGTALWAAGDVWGSLTSAIMVEGSATMRRWGEILSRDAGSARIAWRSADVGAESAYEPSDLVTIGYVLDELDAPARDRLIEAAWRATAGMLVIVEPGTPAGWQRILAARDHLIGLGGHIVAPCPHRAPCPIVAPDWCHFSRRVARSRVHLRGKNAVVPFEDEKFSYVAASRVGAVDAAPARVLAPPHAASGRVTLKLCEPDGMIRHRLVSRRDGDVYRDARRLDWGDTFVG